jgi:hypothetical protein
MPEELPARMAVLVVRAWIEPDGGLRARLIGNLDIERERDKVWEAGRADQRRCRMPGCLGRVHPLVPSSTSSAWCCVGSAVKGARARLRLSAEATPTRPWLQSRPNRDLEKGEGLLSRALAMAGR